MEKFNQDQKEILIKQLREKEGKEAIFREKFYIAHITINDIIVEEQGIRISLRDLRTPGFVTSPKIALTLVFHGIMLIYIHSSLSADMGVPTLLGLFTFLRP